MTPPQQEGQSARKKEEVPEDAQICPTCGLPIEGEFLDMCGGHNPIEGWATEGTLTRGSGIHHYYREGKGRYSWGLKGICHRSGVISKDVSFWPAGDARYDGINCEHYCPTDACRFCVAILIKEGNAPKNLLSEVLRSMKL